MNCAYHSDRPVQGVCNTCGRPICDECLVTVGTHVYCRACLESRMHSPTREVNGTARFILSMVPGLGHLYLGLFQRGIQLGVAAILGGVILGALIEPLQGLFIAAMVFYSIFDAREAHLRIRQGLEVEDRGFVDARTWRTDWNPRYLGWGLVVLGVIALYNTFFRDLLMLIIRDRMLYDQVARTSNGLLLGLLALGAGIWLLRDRMRKPFQ